MSDIKNNLINIVWKYPEIWDKRHGNHHNRYVLSKNWKKIASELGCTEAFAKTTWKNLRQEYGRKLSKSCVDPVAEETPSSWPYFGSMSFIRDQFTPRDTPAHPSLFFKNEIEDSDEETRSDAADHLESYGSADFGAIADNAISRSSSVPSPASCNETVTRTGYGKGTTPNVDAVGELSFRREKLEPREKNHHNSDPNDEDVCFFHSLLTHVKKLNDKEKMIFRMETQKLLFNLAYRKTQVSPETKNLITEPSGSSSEQPFLPPGSNKRVRLSSPPSRDLV